MRSRGIGARAKLAADARLAVDGDCCCLRGDCFIRRCTDIEGSDVRGELLVGPRVYSSRSRRFSRSLRSAATWAAGNKGPSLVGSVRVRKGAK